MPVVFGLARRCRSRLQGEKAHAGSIQARLAALDWKAIEESLWRFGYAKAGSVLTPAECAELAEGARGFYRATVRHRVSRVLSGSRYTLGVIFPDREETTCLLFRGWFFARLSARVSGEEAVQSFGRVFGRLFREKMARVQRAASNIVAPSFPKRDRSTGRCIPGIKRPVSAPECQ